jgi:hypothetical protein
VTDTELARISLVALDSLEARFSGSFSFGLIRRALQRFEATSEASGGGVRLGAMRELRRRSRSAAHGETPSLLLGTCVPGRQSAQRENAGKGNDGTMRDDVLLHDLAAEVGGPDRALALLDQVRAKPAEDPFGQLIVTADAVRAVRELDGRQRGERCLD